MANTITVEIDLDSLKAGKQLDRFDKTAKKKGEKAGESFGVGFLKSFTGNLAAKLFADTLNRITQEFDNVVDAATNLEVIETQFKVLLKTTDAAQKQIKDLQDFAASTPFQLNGLALATRQLLSFGVAQENIIPTLRQIGDLAAGTGSRIDELTIPFGRLVSTQKLTLVELDKFADRGVNLFGQLSKQTGISLGEIRDAISKGKIPFEEFTKALGTLTGKGGTFFQATQKQSETLAGVLSTLDDNVDQLRGSLGTLFTPLLRKSAIDTTKTIQDLNKAVQGFNFKEAITSFQAFNEGLIEFVIVPLELLVNLSDFVGKKVAEGLNAIVSSLGVVGGKIAEFLQFIGVDAPAGLSVFAESSREVFEESAQATQDSFNKIFDFPFSAKIAEANAELSEGLVETEMIIDESVNSVSQSLEKLPATLSKTTQAANKIINRGIVKSFSGGIQTIIQSIAKGENALASFGKFLLSTFGDLAIQLGEFYIATGLANLALLTVDPTAQIATGAALVALGSILKAFSGGGVAGTGGTAASGGALATSEDRDLTEDEDIEDRQTVSSINIEVQGSLVQQEELAQFISDVQNEAREKNGIVDTAVRVV